MIHSGNKSKYCPNCQKLLYNRRLAYCGFCGAQIPENLRFTTEEIAVLDRKIAELQEQRKQREHAAEEERQANADDVGIDFSAFM